MDPPPSTFAGRWNEPVDFDAPLLPNEQQQPSLQPSTPEFDFLIDTSDTVKNPVDDPTTYKSSRQSIGVDYSIWQDMSGLNAPSTPSEIHQQGAESNDSEDDALLPQKPSSTIADSSSLLDTSEDFMSASSTLAPRPSDATTRTMTPLVPERMTTNQQQQQQPKDSEEEPTPPSSSSMPSDIEQKDDEKKSSPSSSSSSSPPPKRVVYRVSLSLGGSQEGQGILTVYEVCREMEWFM